MDMGRTTRGGLAHKIKAYGVRLWSAYTARQSEDILAMKEDLFGYDRYHILCKYLPYSQIDLGLNRIVTLPPRLYKAGKDPIEFISYSIQFTKDTRHKIYTGSGHRCDVKPYVLCSVVCINEMISRGVPARLI